MPIFGFLKLRFLVKMSTSKVSNRNLRNLNFDSTDIPFIMYICELCEVLFVHMGIYSYIEIHEGIK